MTGVLLICAAGLTLAWLVAAQRCLVACAARRFVALPRLEQALVALAVGVMTVCAQKQVTGNKEQGTSAVAEAFGSDASRRAAESAEEEANVVSAENGDLRTETRSSSPTSATSNASVLRAKTTLTSSSSNPCESGQSVALTTNDIVRGYALVEVRTNAMASYEMPTNGVEVGTWGKTGTYQDIVKVEMWKGGKVEKCGEEFSFVLGEQGVSSLWVHTWGKVRPRLRDRAHEIVAVGTPMSCVAGEGRLWTAATTNGGWVITWEKFREGRRAKNISAQIEFFPNGDFITRSNNVECVYRRVNPDDWDDDGIANEEDDEPMIVAETPQFGPNQTLPDGANSNAYYWADLVVPRANAKVMFVGDGASNLADPSFIAKASETNRVTLLIGKSYRATCAFPLEIVAKSSEDIEESWNGENEVELCWPVTISVTTDGDAGSDAQAAAVRQMQAVDSNNGTLLATPQLASVSTMASATSDAFSMIVIPSGLGGSFVWTNYCCSITGTAYAFELACEGNCGCGGCTADGRFVYEGYSIESPWGPSCRCSNHDEDNDSPSRGVSAYFTKNVIIFEDEYEASEGVTMPRRSTRTTLVCSASGGPEGGVATFEIEGESRLVNVSGRSLPITKVLGSNETFRAKIVYEGKPGGGSQPKVTAKFVSDGNSKDVLEASADLTVAQIEIVVSIEADENSSAHRHKFGICEEFFCNSYPSDVGVKWFVSSGSAVDENGRYKCPAQATQNPVKAVCGDAEFTPSIEIVEPNGIVARNPECLTYDVSVGRAGWIGLKQEFYVSPLDVVFGGIRMEEVPSLVGQRTGYFSDPSFASMSSHTEAMGAGVWNRVDRDNRIGSFDKAQITVELMRVNSNGDFTEDTSCGWTDGMIVWAIPFGWTSEVSGEGHADTKPEKTFDPGANQRFTITPTGSVTVEKFGNAARRDIDGKVFCNGIER